jgi:hypothetical protein
VWPRGPRLQGEEAGRAGPREGQQNSRTTKQQNINKTNEYRILMEELHTDSIDGGYEASSRARSRARERAYSNIYAHQNKT